MLTYAADVLGELGGIVATVHDPPSLPTECSLKRVEVRWAGDRQEGVSMLVQLLSIVLV